MSLATKTAPKGLNNDLDNMFRHVHIEHLIAGMSGGVTSALTLHPLDVIKIRFAVNTGRSKSTPRYRGIWDAIRTIYITEGFFGLYRGVVPNVWGAGLSWGMYFLLYTTFKTKVQEGNLNAPLTPSQHLLAASQAGATTLIFTNPFWVVKTRLCLQYGGSCPQQYRGMIDALVKIFRQDGIRGYYKGFVPGLFGASHGAVQFTVYEEFKNRYNEYHNLPITTKLKNSEYLTFAALSKIVAVSVTYPYQVVRARLQSQHYSYKGVFDCVSQTWKYEGWRGFYKGLGPNIIRVTPATMITFITYENVSHFLINYRENKQ